MSPDISQRQGHRVSQTACRDNLRGITSKALERRFWRRKHGRQWNIGCIKIGIQRRTSVGSAGEPAMGDLEFQRELSPEQIREALSLLDSTAGAQNQNLRIGDLRPAKEANLEPDQSSTTTVTQDRPPASEDPQQRKKHLNLAVAFFGIGIAAAGALALLSWRESVSPPPMLGIGHEKPPEQSAAPAAKSDSPALPVAKPPPDQSPVGSERQPSLPEPAGLSGAVRDAANSDSAIPSVARSTTN